ncbi:MAG: glycosyltransferase family 2 protein [Crocinitomicaceae bacterium]|nr:glycosyltransferase family 2 protein [Crocinitomicaceae bacterium]
MEKEIHNKNFKKVAIVLLNWNGIKWLEKFLPIMVEHSCGEDIIVADNLSSDDSISFIQKNYPDIHILCNASNLGFAGGYNAALAQIQGNYKYYAIVNTDIEVTKNWISPLVNFLEENPEVFSVQPKILSQTNKKYFEYAGAAGGFLDKHFYPFCRGRIFSTVEEDKGQYDYLKEVFWTSGACMVMCAERFHALNGFDSDFFAHMEEIDLCWRSKLNGWSCWAIPASTVYHVGGGTLKYESPKKTFLNFRNNLMMIHKNHMSNLFPKIFYRLCLDGIAGVVFLIKLQPKHCIAIIRAHFAYYGQLSKLRTKRKIIQTNKKVHAINLYKGSILQDYFLKSKKEYSALDQKQFTV